VVVKAHTSPDLPSTLNTLSRSDMTSCYGAASQTPHRCCPLANTVKYAQYADRRHTRACQSGPPPQKCPFPRPVLNTCFRVHSQSGISIGSAVLVGLTIVFNTHTDTHGTSVTTGPCSRALHAISGATRGALGHAPPKLDSQENSWLRR